MTVRVAALAGSLTALSALVACAGNPQFGPAGTQQAASPDGQSVVQSTRADVRFGLSADAAAHVGHGGGYWAHPDKNAPTLFVSDLNGGPAQIRIYSAKVKNPPQTGSITDGIDLPINVAVDKQGTLYVANNGNSTVTIYPFGSTSPSLTLSTSILDPNGIAVDSKGTVYVTSGSTVGSCYVLEFPKGATSPSAQVNGFGLPIGLALDKDENLFVADATAPAVWEVPKGSTTPTNLGLSGLSDPTGTAVDGSGDLYVANYQADVTGYHVGTSSPFTTISDGIKNPYALAFNSHGSLFVANYAGYVTAYKKGNDSPYESFSNGMVSPTGIAVYKPSKG
jgi:sugar lactone lactonase YvrE